MGQRLDLQNALVDILGSSNVYFQPPPDLKMVYPCIVYKRDYEQINHANNFPYKAMKRYQVIVIDSNPDSDIPDKLLDLPMCRYDRFYTADNLNHDVYDVFF